MKKWIIVCFLFSFVVVFSLKSSSIVFSENDDELVVYLDPGHGGRDAGANNGTLLEKEIALNISFKIKDKLENLGIKTYITREGDYDLSSGGTNKKREDLNKRVKLINQSDANLVVSIHLNAIESSRWRGAQCFYTEDNKNLATIMQKNMRELLDTNRKAKEIDNIFILDNIKVPGLLIEVGFLSNEEEARLLGSDSYQELIANTILYGILEYDN